MSDLILNKQECKNLIEMIKSKDPSNHEMAKTILASLDLDKNLEWVFIIIAFANKNERFWIDNDFYRQLTKRFGSFLNLSLENRTMSLTLLNSVLPKEVKGKSEYVELYFELYFSEVEKNMNAYGYEFVNKIEIKFKHE